MDAVFVGLQHLLYTWGEGSSHHTDFHLLRCFLVFFAFKIWKGGTCRRWQLLLESRTIFVPNQARIGESISEKIKGNMHLFFLPTRSFSGLFHTLGLGGSQISDCRWLLTHGLGLSLNQGLGRTNHRKPRVSYAPEDPTKLLKTQNSYLFKKTYIQVVRSYVYSLWVWFSLGSAAGFHSVCTCDNRRPFEA